MKKEKVLVTGGGTAGHIMPLVSVIRDIKKTGREVLYVGSGGKVEKNIAEDNDIQYKKILTGKYRRYFDLQNIIDIFKFVFGIFQSFFIVLTYSPDVVFSKGGYVGLPVVYAAWILRKDIYIHETDSVMGLANRMSIRKAKKIFVGFPVKYYQDIPAGKLVYTGNIVSSVFDDVKTRKIFKNNKKTIFITGGSQGSRFINQIIAKANRELTKKYNVIHLCGKNDCKWLSKNKWDDYKLIDFCSQGDFASYLFNCNLVISRSGGTIFEIARTRKPAILIPIDESANGHQESNAKIFERENAAIVLRQKGLTSESLIEIIDVIFSDKILSEKMSEKIGQFDVNNSSKVIVDNLFK